ncbi:MAG: PAS domain-containing sensor histidine kinase [Acidimicrobiales bacterium]
MGVRSPILKAYGDDFAWSLLDATPDATLIASGTGEIVFVNDHAGDLFGYALDDLLGRVVEDLLPEGLRTVHRAHRTRYRAEPTVRAMGSGFDLWAARSDGTEFPVEISLSPLHLGDEVFAVAAVRDISERVVAEDQLHRVMRTIDASEDGMFIFDAATLRFSFVNEGATRLVGYTHDELLDMSPLHLNPYTTESQYRQFVDDLLGEGPASLVRQTAWLRKDGSEVPIEKTLRSAPVDRDGNRAVIVLARDITQRLAAEAQLRHSQDALRQAEQVVAVADDRERIARDLHDTVIQRLFGEGLALQATMSAVGDPHVRARLDATIEGLDQTIKELRTAVFALQGAGAAPGGLRGRLLEVVTEASDGLGFEPRLQFDGPVESIDDDVAQHLIPVLREALSNTARHAEAHSVRVAVSATADVVTLTVADDGVGVPDEVLGGRGLANMTARARDLGGDFEITRRPSGGSISTWHVPAHPSRVEA